MVEADLALIGNLARGNFNSPGRCFVSKTKLGLRDMRKFVAWMENKRAGDMITKR